MKTSRHTYPAAVHANQSTRSCNTRLVARWRHSIRTQVRNKPEIYINQSLIEKIIQCAVGYALEESWSAIFSGHVTSGSGHETWWLHSRFSFPVTDWLISTSGWLSRSVIDWLRSRGVCPRVTTCVPCVFACIRVCPLVFWGDNLVKFSYFTDTASYRYVKFTYTTS